MTVVDRRKGEQHHRKVPNSLQHVVGFNVLAFKVNISMLILLLGVSLSW